MPTGIGISELLLILVVVGYWGLWIWAVVDCATREADQGNTKVVWILIVLLVPLVGPLLYLLVRRPARLREQGA
jgi:hypothetical protein